MYALRLLLLQLMTFCAQWDAFFGLFWPQDPTLWKTHVAPVGAIKSSVAAGGKYPLPSYLSEDDKKAMSNALLQGGFVAPTCYYKVQVRGHRVEDEKSEWLYALLQIVH